MKKVIVNLLITTLMINMTAQQMPTKKIIVHSWDLRVSLEDLARNLKSIEKLPIDGISIFFRVKRKANPKPYFGNIMLDSKWQKEWFAAELEGIKKISSGKLKHNFIFTKLSSRKRLSWNDDSAWEACAHNFGIMAWLARDAGAKGLIIDPEDYHSVKQYTLLPGDGSYSEAAQLARKRGVQVMSAIAKEYPDATLLFFWLLSLQPELYNNGNDPLKNAEKELALWPHFVNGMLDAVSPGIKMIDATENAYRFNAEKMEFYVSALNMSRKAIYLVAPENRSKYRNQVQVGFGLYLDSYTNEPKSAWYLPGLNGSRLKRFHSNFKQAMSVADEYCWLCSEKGRLIKWDSKTKKSPWDYNKSDNPKTWNQLLPGFNKVLGFVKHPETYLKYIKGKIDIREKSSKTSNLIQNSDCRKLNKKNEKLPVKWGFWQKKTSKGEYCIDKNKKKGNSYSVKGTGIADGCFILKTPVKISSSYAVEVWGQGAGVRSVNVRWQSKGKWCQQNMEQVIYFPEKATEGDWQHAFGVVNVPSGADTMVLLLSVKQKNKQSAWFVMPGVYEL